MFIRFKLFTLFIYTLAVKINDLKGIDFSIKGTYMKLDGVI